MPDPLAIVELATRALRPGGFLDTSAGAARFLVKDPKEKGASVAEALVLGGVLPGRWGTKRAIGSVRERRHLASYVQWGQALGWENRLPNFAANQSRVAMMNTGHLSLADLAHSRYAQKGVFDLIGKASRSNRWSMVLSETASWIAKRERTAKLLTHPHLRRGAALAASAARRAYPAFEIFSGTFGLLFPPLALGAAGVWVGRAAGAAAILGGLASTRLALSKSNQPIRGAGTLAMVGMLGAGAYAAFRAVSFVAIHANMATALGLGALTSLGVGGLIYRGLRARRPARQPVPSWSSSRNRPILPWNRDRLPAIRMRRA